MKRAIKELIEELEEHLAETRRQIAEENKERQDYRKEDRAAFQDRDKRIRQILPAIRQLPNLTSAGDDAFRKLVGEASTREAEGDTERSEELWHTAGNLRDALAELPDAPGSSV